MATKSRSKHQGDLYKTYQAHGKQAANRKRKLTRLLKEQPNNLDIVAALKGIKYRRKTPKTTVWSHTRKRQAELKKLFQVTQSTPTQRKVSEKDMYKIRARAHDSQGNLLWNF